ncbi:MAG TPA: hypothetical protein VFT50_01690 [Baekduia sp.]|nr:hypothetical protein [Baekduia sp.]
MGFLDKALRAASAAKDQLDEVRDARAAAQVQPEPQRPLDEHEQRVLERARALGAVDPFILLTAPEAGEILGTPLGAGSFTYSDDMIGVRFAADGPRNQRWEMEVDTFHAADDDEPLDAEAYWHGFLADAVADDGVPVPGLGQAAIARDGEVYVLAGPGLIFRTAASRPGGEHATDAAVEAARRVMSRFA